MQLRATMMAFAMLGTLGACQANTNDGTSEDIDGDPAAQPSDAPADGESVSILRADIEQIELPAAPLEPLKASIGFPDGGSQLDADALAALRKVSESPQIESGAPIVLEGHSDSGGSDEANLRASEARADAVADWLVDQGIDTGRITVIAFGEQNPVEPNALSDGKPNEAGRARNRRVDVVITPPTEAGGNAEG